MRSIPVAMTIAGSDSGGGAGIEADIKTFTALGVFATVAITSVTAQNTYSVKAIYDLPPEIVESQIMAVYEDIGIDAAKTGMLSKSEIIKTVEKVIRKIKIPLVVDPVMAAKSGALLLRPEAIDALKSLLGLSTLVTPNLREAEVLADMRIYDVESMKAAAKLIHQRYGPEAVIIKGGHLPGDNVVDVLYYEGEFRLYTRKRIPTTNTHGSGCTFSAAVTAELAKGKDLFEAVERAGELIQKALEYSLPLGKGNGPVNPIAIMEEQSERWKVIEELKESLNELKKHEDIVNKVIPEVGMNIGMALSRIYSKSPEDIAAVPGRISKYKNGIIFPKEPEFGVSKHIANAILTVMKYSPYHRAAANIAYNKDIERALVRLGLRYSSFDRMEEPGELKTVEGKTTSWGIEAAIAKIGQQIPDVIIDYGEHGKEPLIFVFGYTARDVVNKILKIARSL